MKIKADPQAIRRIPNAKHEAGNLCKLMRLASIFVRHHYVARIRGHDVCPIRRPSCEDRPDVSDGVGRTCWQWLHPELDYGIRPDPGDFRDQYLRAIWRDGTYGPNIMEG